MKWKPEDHNCHAQLRALLDEVGPPAISTGGRIGSPVRQERRKVRESWQQRR